jgi:transposase
MPPLRELPAQVRKKLPVLLHAAKSADQLKRIQCLWLKIKFGFSASEIALALGWHRSSVHRVFAQVQQQGIAALMAQGRGGRRHEYLTWDQERELVERFAQEAQHARIVIVNDIKRAYEEQVGRRVPQSTVYRMLERHQWRKLMPGSAHPKENKEAQQRFKKNSSANCPQ